MMDNSPLGPRGRGLQLIRYHTPLPPTRFVAHLAYAFRAFPCPPPRTFFSRTPRGWITQRRRRLYRPLAEQNTPRQASARSATPHHGSPHSQGGEETREGNGRNRLPPSPSGSITPASRYLFPKPTEAYRDPRSERCTTLRGCPKRKASSGLPGKRS